MCRNWILLYCYQECNMQSLLKTTGSSSKGYTELLHDLAILLIGFYPRKMKTCSHKNLQQYYAQQLKVETTQCLPTDERKKSYNDYLAIKRNKVLIDATTRKSLENMKNKGSQSQKTTYCMIPFNEMLTIGKSTETKQEFCGG